MTKGVLVANDAHAPKSPYERRLCRLAFLAPDLQRAILDGHQPPGLTLDQLLKAEISPDWSRQRALLATAF